jgi:virginiamycin A acetyltransferase
MNPNRKTLTARIPEYRYLDIGEYTFGAPRMHDATFHNLKIGKFVLFGIDVLILPGGTAAFPQHATSFPLDDYFKPFVAKPPDEEQEPSIIIENDVVIGDRVTICPGAMIANGVIVLPGSVVQSELAPYTIAWGNPAQSVEARFPEEWIDALNRRIRWWEWPIDKILSNQALLNQPPGDHLLELYGEPPALAKIKGRRRRAAEPAE